MPSSASASANCAASRRPNAHHPIRRQRQAGQRATLLGQPDVDGALVGGASLKAEDFLAIVRAAV